MIPGWEQNIERGEAAFSQDDCREASNRFESALQEAEACGDSLHLARALDCCTKLSSVQHRYADTVDYCRRALVLKERLFGPDDPSLIPSLLHLAATRRLAWRFSQQEATVRRACSIAKRSLPSEHLDRLAAAQELALVRQVQGKLDEAWRLQSNIVATCRSAGPGHTRCLAEALLRSSFIAGMREDYPTAEENAREALAREERASGVDHPLVVGMLNALAKALHHRGAFRDEEAALQRCAAIVERVAGTDAARTAQFEEDYDDDDLLRRHDFHRSATRLGEFSLLNMEAAEHSIRFEYRNPTLRDRILG